MKKKFHAQKTEHFSGLDPKPYEIERRLYIGSVTVRHVRNFELLTNPYVHKLTYSGRKYSCSITRRK